MREQRKGDLAGLNMIYSGTSSGNNATTEMNAPKAEFLRLLSLFLVMALCVVLIKAYQLENDTFQELILLAAVGFPISALLPIRHRLLFFVLLSISGIALLFGLTDTIWLLATGVLLIGLCHLPISYGLRVAVILLVAIMLGVSRAGVLAAPWGHAVWPILASMFMFRLALYLHAVHHNRVKPGFLWTAAYFFMLPNAMFPLFPVVDYITFTRTYFDQYAVGIYRTGVIWIVRGLVQLILYRVVYLYVVNDTADIFDLGDLLQFMMGTFLLYLRVSGQFHLIIGILLLFGFRLPETHRLYYLSSSFTDFWRRINIYWKDFMMKLVFYPVHHKLRGKGPTTALVIATIVVFFVTWLLHSYQWFWLRGDLFFSAPDALFWGILALLVIGNTVLESRGKRRPLMVAGWHLRRGITTAATFTTICILWSLWSSESIVTWLWLWQAGGHASTMQVIALIAILSFFVVVGGWSWAPQRGNTQPEDEPHWGPITKSGALLITLIVLAQPSAFKHLPNQAEDVIVSVTRHQLNARDEVLQNRGYYENLDMRNQLSSHLLDLQDQNSGQWKGNQYLNETGIIQKRRDFLHQDFAASQSINWNGETFSTNRWGMRDQDYELVKPEDTVRVAILGMSIVMGAFVSDGEPFEALLEDRLAGHPAFSDDTRIEILNFAVSGYELPRQMAMLEDRALDFNPDIVIIFGTDLDRYHTEDFLHKTVFDDYFVPYDELNQILKSAGLLNVDRSGIGVPFAWARAALGHLGIDTRMPWNEGWARVRGLGDPVNDWILQRVDRLCRESGAMPVLVLLNAVRQPAKTEPQILRTAQGLDWVTMDLRDVYEKHDYAELVVTPWDSHPNQRGHRVIANRLYEEFVRNWDRLGLPR